MEDIPVGKKALQGTDLRRSERLKELSSKRVPGEKVIPEVEFIAMESTRAKSTPHLGKQLNQNSNSLTAINLAEKERVQSLRSERINFVPERQRANSSIAKSIDGDSKKSRKSEVIRLNLELKKLQQQKQFEEEEHKLLEKRRDTRLKIIEIEQQLLTQEIDIEDEIESVSQEVNLYEDSDYLNKWVESVDIKQDSPVQGTSGFVVGGNRGETDLLLNIAKQCVQNSTNTNTLLIQQKMRELIHFSGDITEWPIFINEFKRSTEQYRLTEYDNLLRLDRSLKGNARETVKALLTMPENVPKIIKILETNFGRSDWIILSLMDKVRKFNVLKEENIESSIAFLNALNNMVITIRNINAPEYLFNPEMLQKLVEKLPPMQKYNWGKFKYESDINGKSTSLADFTEWYEAEVGVLAATCNPFQRNKCSRKQSVMTLKDYETKMTDNCLLCKNIHNIKECKQFLDKTVEQRRQSILTLKLCFLCLKDGHTFKRCNKKGRCGVNGCKGRHNHLLHLERSTNNRETSEEIHSPSIPTPVSDFCANVTNRSEKVLLRIAPVILRADGREINTYALFDEGSTCTMIEEELAEKIELHGPQIPLCYQWTNDITHFEDTSQLVSFQIAANFNKKPKFYKLNNVRTVKNLNLPHQNLDAVLLSQQFNHLDLSILRRLQDAKPKLLIGQDNCGLIVPRQVIQPRLNQPILSYAKLGWTVHGVVNESSSYTEPIHVHLCCKHSADEELHLLVKNSSNLEDFGIKSKGGIKSVEDKKAVKIMEKTLHYIGNRFEIGHLYKHEDVTFPDSKSNALKRLSCMERKMDRDKEFAKQYCQKFEDYLHKGYATKLEKWHVTENPRDWYLPHFAVWNENKPGQIRLVFDAAAKSHGYCINDFLFQGPDYVPPLIAVLWRFCQGRIAISGDIKEMFHQVVIRKEDRCSQRFFWRGGNKNQEPDVYHMNVMIFGAISSPSKAQFVKNKNAERFQADFPNIIRAITKQHYVDDYLDSCDSEAEAIKQVQQVIHVHKAGGFEMKKWISNSSAVISSNPEDIRGNMSSMNIDTNKIERVLGLSWSPRTDEFVFTLNFKKIPNDLIDCSKIPSKREVLRIVMSVFDPLGFLAPLMVKARILMQNIWRYNVEWNAEIPDSLFPTWKQWLNDLHSVSPIKINRCYFPRPPPKNRVDLHVFSDASDKAYSAVAYIRFVDSSEIFTSFVTSKFKVAPIAQQTIPKLELQGAVLACRLAKTVCSEIEYEVQSVYFWTDSLVVLKQIRSESRRFPMFVACRVGEIQENTNVKQWHWVPSDQNVADLATKEVKDLDLNTRSKWFLGPAFLKRANEYWPSEPKCEIEDCCLLVDVIQDNQLELPDVYRFSKYRRLLRATAWIVHFVNMIKLRKENRKSSLILDVETLETAKILLIQKCQRDSFAKELMDLKKKNEVRKNSRLFKLSPILDKKGIIRLQSRFPDSSKLNLSYDMRYSIILDDRHRFTQLLIDNFHREAGHIGVETVISNIRQTYWILHTRSAVKKSFKNCRDCKIRKAKPIAPEMGLLPPERLEPYVFPFSYVGIDFFGPITITVGRRNEKRYGVLFTCLTIRAVHIEIAASLDTSSTILAIRRFMARRGQPVEIFTDNGTNFVGAERELREYIQNLDNHRINDELSSKGVTWKFNPPGAPNMGGIWERMVRSIKTALKVTLKTAHPKEEVLQTLLTEAEYTVNSRPLTHISVDPNELVPITPNHFLLLRSGTVALSENPGDIISRKQWLFAETLANSYWKRWILEFRPTLVSRQKWCSKSRNFNVDDVVIIVDEKAPRNEWLMGRILETYPGKDGVVRVVSVSTKKGTYKRPVSKLCLIATDSEECKSSRGGGC